ncbi:HPP family protein [Megalodesulfovibrio paquesii]
MNFLDKLRCTSQSPPRVSTREVLLSWLGSFLGIAALGVMQQALLDPTAQTLLIGSFGATAVLVYAAFRSPLAQPRNVLGGHVLSAVVGVLVQQQLDAVPWLAAAMAVSLAIALMHVTKTLHPPGGATALIAVIGGPSVHRLGLWFALYPVGLGAVVLLGIALAVNNIPRSRRYPEFWW